MKTILSISATIVLLAIAYFLIHGILFVEAIKNVSTTPITIEPAQDFNAEEYAEDWGDGVITEEELGEDPYEDNYIECIGSDGRIYYGNSNCEGFDNVEEGKDLELPRAELAPMAD